MPNPELVSNREAVYDINRYLTEQFYEVDATIFGEDPPFWPAQSEPETRPPYVRYIARETVDGENWWMRQGTISYAVYAFNLMQSAHIVNIMIDLLARGDSSAQELMAWRQSLGGYPQDYDFHSIDFMGGHNTEPATEEAGAHIRFATFRYQYTPRGGTDIV